MSTSFQADISPELAAKTPIFRGYDDQSFQIGDVHYQQGICIHNNEIISPWGADSLHQLETEHLNLLIDRPPEFLVLGTGRLTAFPKEEVLKVLSDLHIGFECMDSRAAARTYNILVAEGRNVSACMLLPSARN
ncbi:MAG: MTH938/NDUFAF3 family protein [Mariprofundaceae bacterium]